MPDRPNRPPRKPRSGPGSNPITPFNRTGRLPQIPDTQVPGETPAPQGQPFSVRLDPNAAPGEFNFVIDAPQVTARIPRQDVTEAEAFGHIPPVLYQAVDEVLAFIFNLDQEYENRGRKPNK